MYLKLSILIVVLAALYQESFGAAPTKTPSAKPTFLPSWAPTKIPTAKPTWGPTVLPTARPTQAPSTATPSVNPTATPSARPTTATPTRKPTAEPTLAPTARPTVLPTTAPTADPTANPTEWPTVLPTTAPTADPTFEPTFNPTNEPTIPPPSARPTIRPTAVPTLTIAPTASPTRQMYPVVNWVTNITLDGVAQPKLDTDCQRTVIITTASILNLPSTAVTFLRSGPATQGRRLQSNVIYTFMVSLQVQVPMSPEIIAINPIKYATPQSLSNFTQFNLENAVHHGAYDSLIQTNAVEYGTPDLIRASSYQITESTAVVTEPDFSKDENLDLTSGGTAIIVICALVMFFVVLYMAWTSSHAKKEDQHGLVQHAAPKGYTVAEDEEDDNTTINKL